MALENVHRYNDLIRFIVSGEYYSTTGSTIPFYSAPVEFRLETDSPNTDFGVYVNEVFTGFVTSDAVGNIVFSRKLPLGEVELGVVDSTTGRSISTYLTVREYATVLASYAESLETVDDNLQRVAESIMIRYSQVNEIEEIFGQAVGMYMDIGADLSSYRWLIQELRLAYRDMGTRAGGLNQAVGEFCQTEPFNYQRRFWGPNWVLDQSFLVNHRFKERSHVVRYGASTISGVSLLRVEPDCAPHVGALFHLLDYDPAGPTLQWRPDSAGLTDSVPVAVKEGEYFLPGPFSPEPAYITGYNMIFTVTAGVNDYLYLNLDDKGIIAVQLTTALPNPISSQIVADINAALVADIRYGATYAAAAVSYGLKVQIICPSAQGSKVEILHGPQNVAGEVFGCNTPGTATFAPDVADGIRISTVYGANFDVLGGAQVVYEYDGTVTPATQRVRWEERAGNLGVWVNLTEDGAVDLVDALGNRCRVYCVPSEMEATPGVLTTYNYAFDLGYFKTDKNIAETKGLWVRVTEADLPPVSQSVRVVVLDDSNDPVGPYLEAPDYWILGAGTPGVSTTAIEPSRVSSDRQKDLDPATAYRYLFEDGAVNDFEIVAPVEKFIPTSNLPRGKTWPMRDWGGVYDYPNYEIKLAGWFNNFSGSVSSVTLSFSFDGGATWVSSALPWLFTDAAAGRGHPTFLEFSTLIPVDVTLPGVYVRVQASGFGTALSLDALTVEVKYISSRVLTNATVPRNRQRQYFGNLVWCWSPTEMTLVERKYIGLQFKDSSATVPYSGVLIENISYSTPAGNGLFEYEYNSAGPIYRVRWTPYGTSWTPGMGWVQLTGDGTYTLSAPDGSYLTLSVTYSLLPTLTGPMPVVRSRMLEITDPTTIQGHSRRIMPAHASVDVFDATEYDPASGSAVNLLGATTEADFSLCGLVNTEVYSANPFKYSFVYPEFENVAGEVLTFVPSGPDYVTTLDYYSDQDQVAATLYKDGISLPNDVWSFTAADGVLLAGAEYTGSSVYTLDYNLLYQITTSVIDLGTLINPSTDYVWFANYFLWDRFDKEQGAYTAEIPVYFSVQNGRAFLPQVSDMNKSTSELVVEIGTERITVARRYWRYIDNTTIQIDISQIVPGQYYLSYEQQRVYNRSRLTKVFEHRSGITVPAMLAASWAEIEKNSAVDVSGLLRYHQLRLSVSGARTVGPSGDFRIRALMVRGLRLHGSSPSVPGLTNVWSVW